MLVRDYKVRVFGVLFCFLSLFLIIVIRLFLIQIHQKNFFQNLARNQYEVEITLNPARAIIYDRTGVMPLAFNHQVPSAFILTKQLAEPKKVIPFLKRHYPDVYKRMKDNSDKYFFWLERKLTKEKYDYLVRCDLKDIQFIDEYQRFYPCFSAAQIVGFTDIDNNGIAGIECHFSKTLSGSPSTVQFEKDARSDIFYFKKNIAKKGARGKFMKTYLYYLMPILALLLPGCEGWFGHNHEHGHHEHPHAHEEAVKHGPTVEKVHKEGTIKEINTTDSYYNFIEESNKPVVVDFCTEWCGMCKEMEPTMKELAQEFAHKYEFIKVDLDKAAGLQSKYNITGVPTVLFINKGKEVGRVVGAEPKEKMIRSMESAFSK